VVAQGLVLLFAKEFKRLIKQWTGNAHGDLAVRFALEEYTVRFDLHAREHSSGVSPHGFAHCVELSGRSRQIQSARRGVRRRMLPAEELYFTNWSISFVQQHHSAQAVTEIGIITKISGRLGLGGHRPTFGVTDLDQPL